MKRTDAKEWLEKGIPAMASAFVAGFLLVGCSDRSAIPPSPQPNLAVLADNGTAVDETPPTASGFASNLFVQTFSEIHRDQHLLTTNRIYAEINGQMKLVAANLSGQSCRYSSPNPRTLIQSCTYYVDGSTAAVVRFVHRLPEGICYLKGIGLCTTQTNKSSLVSFSMRNCRCFSQWEEAQISNGLCVRSNVISGSRVRSLNGRYDYVKILPNGLLEAIREGGCVRRMTSLTQYEEQTPGEDKTVTE